MMGDLKACTEDIDMFDTFYTKKSTFSSYYDKLTKGKKFRGADGKKITNKYSEHLDINHENDSVVFENCVFTILFTKETPQLQTSI